MTAPLHVTEPTPPAGDEAAPMLSVDGLQKSFSGNEKQRILRAGRVPRSQAVRGVTFTVAPGQLFTLLGPSGCGKTTTLRSIAGLETPDAGLISIAGQDLFNAERRVNVPTERRALGMVFQSYAIWPHMTVFENVAFPLRVGPRRNRVSGSVVRTRVMRTLESVGLDALAQRFATALSGGQQQRLALARALVVEPRVLLLDEPLSNLDAKLRESMRLELKRMQTELGITTVYVTHDQTEALAMSDVVAVMSDGEIVQTGNPADIYQRPNSRFVAQFIGMSNLLPGTTRGTRGGGTLVEAGGAQLLTGDRVTRDSGGEVLVSIRPEDLRLSAEDDEPVAANRWCGTVQTRAFLGESTTYVVRVGETTMQCKGDPLAAIAVGDTVWLTAEPDRVRLIEDAPDEDAPDKDNPGGGA